MSHNLQMTPLARVRSTTPGPVEHEHRGIKQHCCVERAQCNHIGLCSPAFLRLERYRYRAEAS